ncbi:MAG: Holliday junction resolvase RuvX [Tissierellia bacterium]|nr:Holliday junction resolvase RuvX [Tissierellia bacterium]
MNERILGLDVGDVRIGVSVSDPIGIMALGVDTINRTSNKYAYEEIENYIKQYNVNKIVVGMPYNMDGSLSEQGEKIKKFATKLGNKTGIDIIYFDERLTSKSAERILIEGDIKRANRKKYIDKIAATIILQTYLDSRV